MVSKCALDILKEGEEQYYLVLEYNPLYRTLENSYDFYNANKIGLFEMICESIFTLNQDYGFVHADLKYDNVMIEYDIEGYPKGVKNFDFDLSFLLMINQKFRTLFKCKVLGIIKKKKIFNIIRRTSNKKKEYLTHQQVLKEVKKVVELKNFSIF